MYHLSVIDLKYDSLADLVGISSPAHFSNLLNSVVTTKNIPSNLFVRQWACEGKNVVYSLSSPPSYSSAWYLYVEYSLSPGVNKYKTYRFSNYPDLVFFAINDTPHLILIE